ncbi:transposase [Methylorubrum extorquens]|nr:transposase [Methylorubrum extorquens]MCP1591726.1 transposase [Methylorubrum extorquens]
MLAGLNERFESLYSGLGRPSIPPEMLLRATLLQAFFSVRSERMLMEQIDYYLLFRWFVGLEIDAPVWHPTVFTHTRDRLLETEVARAFLSGLLSLNPVKRFLSSEHFSVDGTMIDAWASMKSFRPKDGSGEPPGPGRNGERDFRKEKRSNATHASTTDADARLYRKADGQESRLCYLGHALMENRNGLVVDASLTHATGTAEREAALLMLDRRPRRHRITLGADKLFDVEAFVGDLRARQVTPHVAINGVVSKTRQGAQDRPRRPYDAPCRLRDQPALPQADRGGLRLDQSAGGAEEGQAARAGQGRGAVHLRGGRLQPRAPAQAAGTAGRLTGRHRPPARQPGGQRRPSPVRQNRSDDKNHLRHRQIRTSAAAC